MQQMPIILWRHTAAILRTWIALMVHVMIVKLKIILNNWDADILHQGNESTDEEMELEDGDKICQKSWC